MRLWAIGVALVLTASGCLGGTSGPDPTDVPPATDLLPSCDRAGMASPGMGVCAWFMAPGPAAHYEASLAVHPTDPDTVVVTWTERGGGVTQVWSAVTTDGGGNWTTTLMHDPAVLRGPGVTNYAFDSIADFTADGRAVVFYGGESSTLMVPTAAGGAFADLADRMTVALSDDGGATWTHHVLSHDPMENRMLSNDFMDIGVAPDGDGMVVVAQAFRATPAAWAATPAGSVPAGVREPAGTHVWTSSDGGATWSGARMLETPPKQAIVPRVTMGPGGLVVLTAALVTQAPFDLPGEYHGLVAYVSRDGGGSFEAPVPIAAPESNRWLGLCGPAIQSLADGTVLVDVVLNEGDRVLQIRSTDAGATWGEPQEVGRSPGGADMVWSVAAPDDAGGIEVVSMYSNACDDEGDGLRWGVVRLSYRGGARGATPLTETLDVAPTGCWPSNDYGGIDVAADGSVWASWSDPRPDPERAHIAITRLAPPG